MVRLDDGRPVNRPGLAGEFRDLTEQHQGRRVQRSVRAGSSACATRDVACVITEPVLTNCCMVLPEPGFHDALRKLTRADRHAAADRRDAHHLDRPGGYTRKHGLEPDLFVLGKPIAGGVPASVWGMSDDVADALRRLHPGQGAGYSGMGTTLSANPLQFAAMRATLEEVMTDDELRPHGTAGAAARRRA